jgi:hypothetical protein
MNALPNKALTYTMPQGRSESGGGATPAARYFSQGSEPLILNQADAARRIGRDPTWLFKMRVEHPLYRPEKTGREVLFSRLRVELIAAVELGEITPDYAVMILKGAEAKRWGGWAVALAAPAEKTRRRDKKGGRK